MANENLSIKERLMQEFPTSFKKENKKTKTKNNRKGLIVGVIAGVLALATAISFAIANRKKKVPTDTPTTSITSSVDAMDLNNLGTDLEFETEYKPEYGNVTGNVDKDKIVEKDGTYYVDQDSANKSDKVGNVSVDTKNDTLVVKPNGTVVEKNPGYEVKDENGKVVDSGEGSAPDNFEKNENLGGTFEKEDQTSNLVCVDRNYYNEEGKLVLEKGMFVSKDTLEYAKKNLSTTPNQVTTSTPSSNVTSQPTTSTPSSNTSSTSKDKGVVNPDGTYTIDGITYLSKADYEQCIIDGYEGYAIIDGIMQPIANFQTKTQLVK